ncbi:hypothetical protein PMIN01_07705 [Paraphaeosphaeria minitans]|uniref:Uncharacterized protein n=1 Tax=Paraphaeosphaeria minitans TaxID=565426 RepID=A0A9P6GFQ1_9PLEO|nr:hypothetical protein PMIN01_07705 [Paraphaeosphaeria minitans]
MKSGVGHANGRSNTSTTHYTLQSLHTPCQISTQQRQVFGINISPGATSHAQCATSHVQYDDCIRQIDGIPRSSARAAPRNESSELSDADIGIVQYCVWTTSPALVCGMSVAQGLPPHRRHPDHVLHVARRLATWNVVLISDVC